MWTEFLDSPLACRIRWKRSFLTSVVRSARPSIFCLCRILALHTCPLRILILGTQPSCYDKPKWRGGGPGDSLNAKPILWIFPAQVPDMWTKQNHWPRKKPGVGRGSSFLFYFLRKLSLNHRFRCLAFLIDIYFKCSKSSRNSIPLWIHYFQNPTISLPMTVFYWHLSGNI